MRFKLIITITLHFTVQVNRSTPGLKDVVGIDSAIILWVLLRDKCSIFDRSVLSTIFIHFLNKYSFTEHVCNLAFGFSF